MFSFKCVKKNFGSTLVSPKIKISYILEEKKQGNISYIFEACCSLGITYDNDSWYHMLIISLKENFVYVLLTDPFIISAPLNLCSWHEISILIHSIACCLGFLSNPYFLTGTSLDDASAEFSLSHPVLPRLHILFVRIRVHAKRIDCKIIELYFYMKRSVIFVWKLQLHTFLEYCQC